MENKKILIVEDEKVLVKVLNIDLLSAGYQIISATNGEAGLQLIRSEKPDLVLLDLLMPIMNGIEVLEEMQKDEDVKHIPVFVFTNNDKAQDRSKVIDLGARDVFIKSDTRLEDLVEKIKEALS